MLSPGGQARMSDPARSVSRQPKVVSPVVTGGATVPSPARTQRQHLSAAAAWMIISARVVGPPSSSQTSRRPARRALAAASAARARRAARVGQQFSVSQGKAPARPAPRSRGQIGGHPAGHSNELVVFGRWRSPQTLLSAPTATFARSRRPGTPLAGPPPRRSTRYASSCSCASDALTRREHHHVTAEHFFGSWGWNCGTHRGRPGTPTPLPARTAGFLVAECSRSGSPPHQLVLQRYRPAACSGGIRGGRRR